MTINKMKNKKIFIAFSIFIFMFALTIFLIVNQRNSIIQEAIISKLAVYGFNEASIEKLNLTSNNLKLYNLKLSETIHIGYLQANYKLSANTKKPLTISNVTLDKVTFIYIKGSEKPSIDPINKLKEVLSENIPVENLTIRMAKITIASGHELPIEKIRLRNIKVKINNIEHKVNVIGKANFESGIANIYANFTATADSTGNINFGYEIENGDFNFPKLKGKRLSGWSEFFYKNNKLNSQASINIGSASIMGIPFNGITMTYKDTPTKILLINGRSLGDVVRLSIALNLSKLDKNNYTTIDGKIDISAKKLEKLAKLVEKSDTEFPLEDIFKNMSGSTNIRLNFKGKKANNTIKDIFNGWNDFKSSLSATLTDLIIPEYPNKINATIQTSFQPIKDGVKLNNIDLSASYGKIIKYKGSTTANIKIKPHLYANIKNIKGILESPKYNTKTSIENGKLSFNSNKQTIINSEFNTIINYRNNPLVPIYADVSLSYSKNKIASFKLIAQDKNKYASANITGHISTIDNSGNIKINVPPINFTETGTKPHNLIPSLKNILKNTSGTIGLNANISLPDKTTIGTLLIKNIYTDYNGNPLKNLNATIKLDHLLPLHIKHQTIAIESFNLGIPFYDGLVKFSYDASLNKSLHIENASWKMAGGLVSIDDLKINPSNPDVSFDLNISDIALQQLFTLAPLDGLEATGIVEGKLPVTIKGSDVIIKNGNLITTTKGKISYAPKDLPAFLQDSSNQNIVYLRQALNNFHYDDLSFTINGKAGDQQEIKLHAEGRNPDFTEQRPIILNLNLQGTLENILNQQTKAYTIPDNISEQIKKYEEENANKN